MLLDSIVHEGGARAVRHGEPYMLMLKALTRLSSALPPGPLRSSNRASTRPAPAPDEDSHGSPR